MTAFIRTLGRRFVRTRSTHRPLLTDRRGTATVEFAILAPVLIVLVLGVVDVTRMLVMYQKMERAAHELGNAVTYSETLTQDLANDIASSVDQITKPYTFNADGLAIISSITNTGGSNNIDWQASHGGDSGSSKVGSTGGTATVPAALTLADGDQVVSVEVMYEYRPLFLPDLFAARQMYFSAYYRPRSM